MSEEDIIRKLNEFGMNTVIVSGGEPFMQQKQLLPLFNALRIKGYWIEVETNGTLVPRPEFMELVNQVNCSPKLSNNQEDSLKHRWVPKALDALASHPKVNFKFVIEKEQDLTEVLQLVKAHKMREVRLMPECRTKEELLAKEDWLKDVCAQYGFIYCTRLSILKSGTLRGV